MAFVRSCWKLPPCPTEPMPAGSKMDPLLAKAEPISDSGSVSGTTYLRRGGKLLCNSRWQRGVRICEGNNPADTKARGEGAGGGAPGAGAEIPLQPVVVHGGEAIHLQPMDDPTPEQVGARRRLCPRGGPTLEQPVPEGLQPVEGTHAGAVRGELQPMGRTHAGDTHGGLSPVEGTPRWSRGRVMTPAPEKEGAP